MNGYSKTAKALLQSDKADINAVNKLRYVAEEMLVYRNGSFESRVTLFNNREWHIIFNDGKMSIFYSV